MRFLYVCPKCRKIFSAESEIPSKTQECFACETKLIYSGYTKDEWDRKTTEEKAEIKETILKQFVESEVSIEVQVLKLIENMDKNIGTVKNILVFFTILFVIGAIYMFIMFSKYM